MQKEKAGVRWRGKGQLSFREHMQGPEMERDKSKACVVGREKRGTKCERRQERPAQAVVHPASWS